MKQKFDFNLPFHSKYRPKNFNGVIGQDHIISYFKKSILNQRLSFAYLFFGKHGVGKTTLSRIIAKSLNCHNLIKEKTYEPCNQCLSCINISRGQSFDIHEINAALNTGIDSIRDLIEKTQFSSVTNKYKVCIIDEVHMLSANAFNALLKVLEEPPKNVLFILATTDIKRIPSTIISRCHKLCFLPLSKKDLALAIANIVWLEQGKITNKGLLHVLNSSKGSFRDALNMVDMLMIEKKIITQNSFSSLFAEIPYSVSQLFVKYLVSRNISKLLLIYFYIQNKEWLVVSLVKQVLIILEEHLIINDISVLNDEYLISLWQIFLEYDSSTFSSDIDIFPALMSDISRLIVLYQGDVMHIQSRLSKKNLPFYSKVNNILIY